MKTKIFGGIAIVAIAVVVAFNVSVSNQKSDHATLLALANVEALADGEAVGGGRKPYQVYSYGCSMWYMDYSCTSTYTHHLCVIDCGRRV